VSLIILFLLILGLYSPIGVLKMFVASGALGFSYEIPHLVVKLLRWTINVYHEQESY
jgi:hypothetical protein